MGDRFTLRLSMLEILERCLYQYITRSILRIFHCYFILPIYSTRCNAVAMVSCAASYKIYLVRYAYIPRSRSWPVGPAVAIVIRRNGLRAIRFLGVKAGPSKPPLLYGRTYCARKRRDEENTIRLSSQWRTIVGISSCTRGQRRLHVPCDALVKWLPQLLTNLLKTANLNIHIYKKNMSASLTWMLVKDNNCFLRKQRHSGGVQLSLEPYNLDNKNRFTSSGLANGAAIDVSSGANGISMKLKGKDSVSLAKNNSRKMNQTIKSSTASYRADLARQAMARYSQLNAASKVKAGSRGQREKRSRYARQ